MAKKTQKTKQALAAHRAVMGLMRKHHFESGGDLASWRGRAGVYSDRKKAQNKHACRRRIEWS